jgi:hypothetical protein
VDDQMSAAGGTVAVDLYWLPLGAGGHCVRFNGRVYEALAARLQRRSACDLYHSALRLWRGGSIPDLAEAVDSPRHLSNDEHSARRVLDLVGQVPTPVWGRDELGAGEMWNSNSVIAWVIARSGIEAESVQPPTGGRAPGWQAGLDIARRQYEHACQSPHAAS